MIISLLLVCVTCVTNVTFGVEPDALPVVRVTADNTRIDASCLVEIDPGATIADTDNNGVIHVVRDEVVVRFADGAVLRGAPPESPWDTLAGIGIRIDSVSGVRVENARVHGYRNAILATRADDLVIAGGDFSDNFRQRLRSTPAAEDGADWLFPHRNDEVRWRDQYGGAVCVESSDRVSIHDIRVRRGQNGIILDRVNNAKVYDNDCSFLSGWGLAMWRSSLNVISRNAFDFCVRGHSEGVYNRGQDSAGILVFEQCSENSFVRNSATHGGDGFFGFAGRDAIGEPWLELERARLRKELGRDGVDDQVRVPDEVARTHADRGCNDNLLVDNDFSYAPAHGIEMTFSRGNRFLRNRVVENAICGVWGGYSSDTLIAGNHFERNGGMAYGLERGAINIEHGSRTIITDNAFIDNRCGVHLWWDNDAGLRLLPGVVANAVGVRDNIIAGNRMSLGKDIAFVRGRDDERFILLHLRDAGKGNVTGTVSSKNTITIEHPRGVEVDAPEGVVVTREGDAPAWNVPPHDVPGEKEPVGARPHLRGRDKIIMGEWGPWDHESVMVRAKARSGSMHTYECFGSLQGTPTITRGKVIVASSPSPDGTYIHVTAGPGVHAYRVVLQLDSGEHVLEGTIIGATWLVKAFAWTPATDPRENLAGWRALADDPNAVQAQVNELRCNYGSRGPRDLAWNDDVRTRGPGGDRFGMLATAVLHLPRGRWRFTTLSDDGVRVIINQTPIIENWTWHGPTRDAAVYEQQDDEPVRIVVEHFEIDGHSVLELDIQPAN